MASAVRRFGRFLCVCAQSTACVGACFLLMVPAYASNPIQIENAKPGTTDWQITDLAYNHEIEGYASLTSVNRGGQISLFVNTGAPTYTIEIFRMGWYDGTGGRRMTTAVTLPGTQQPAPTTDPVTGLIECAWTNPYVLNIPNNTSDPTDWASGVYLAKLTASASGKQRYIIFVVRDDARPSDYFFQASVMTYQAYNNWGGKSLYGFNSTNGPARKVSFNRPYEQSVYADPDGAGHFLGGWEYNMVRFLEREGYDVTYATDLDQHENANLLLSHKGFLAVGHDEYWSWQMRNNVVAARDKGVSLAFFAGNTCYWQVRLEPSSITGAPDRTIVGYKDFAYTEDPYYLDTDHSNDYLVTVRWRDAPLNLPEDAFIGVMYESDPVDADIVVADASNWAFSTTGLNNGDHLPGLLGYEVDREFSNTPPGTEVLGHSPYPFSGTTRYSDMTAYTAASSSTVFATGSIQWSWGLDDYNAPDLHTSRLNPAAQQITRNVLARLIPDLPPLADPGGPYSGTATQPIQFNGSGSSDPDGVVVAYEWDFGDGATDTGNPVAHAYSSAGTYTVTLIVTDDKGSRNAATKNATITASSPAVALSPTSLSFGNQLVGSTSASQNVTLTNPGGATLNISSIVASGDFAQSNNCGASVAAGASCTISVTFAPTATGVRTGAVTITDDAAGSPHQATLTGTGTASAVSLSAASLSFGIESGQRVGTTSAPQTVTLTNVGSATLNIASIAASGDFAQNNNCGTSVAAGANCTISVTFTPTATGTRSGAVTITDNAADSPQQVTLSGTGTAPTVSLSATSLNFGNQLVGSTSPAQSVTLTNTGTATLNITNITASGNFAQTNTCGTSVAHGASCTISVTFSPTTTGPCIGAVTITDDATGSPHQISLSGTGTAPAVGLSASSLSFGDQIVGTVSASQPITLTNSGNATLTIASIVASGDFSQTSTCSGILAPGANCTISVVFTPNGLGTRTGTMTIVDNASGSPHTVSLSGTGTGIAVTAPNGGEVWNAGTTQTIGWSFAGSIGSTVKIELLKRGVLNSTITASTSIGGGGSGSFSWAIPGSQPVGTDYTVRVTSTTSPSATDGSNANFRIDNTGIVLVQPNGGDTWVTGTARTIRWIYGGNVGSKVNIHFFKSGVLNTTIAASAPIGSNGSGSFDWAVPANQTTGADYTIRVTSVSNLSANDLSDRNFTISATNPPNGGGDLGRGGSSVAPARTTKVHPAAPGRSARIPKPR